jgi:hypothetical protein
MASAILSPLQFIVCETVTSVISGLTGVATAIAVVVV